MLEYNMSEELMKALDEASKVFNDTMKILEEEQEKYWNSLTKKQQLDVFCAVSRRIYQGEIVDEGSYRHVLYTVFGWGPEAYAAAQMAGYLEIHNSIYAPDHDRRLLEEFCKKFDLEYYVDEWLKNPNVS
jgi:DNA-directed RNA polymerase subunit E'/Rpb7